MAEIDIAPNAFQISTPVPLRGRTRDEINDSIKRTPKALRALDDSIRALDIERDAYTRQLVELLRSLNYAPAVAVL